MKKTLVLISTFFNIGNFPIAPGTLASAVTTGIFFLANYLFNPLLSSQILAIIIIFLIGIPAARAGESHFGKKDPHSIVIDEVAGQMITLLFLTAEFTTYSISFYIAGFFIFRFFDILKPFPVNIADRLKGGFGIMFDDVVAGLYSLGTVQLIRYLFFN
ncbi:MAG: phosphatidylglycerophosphatase A [Acidobacteriota bacterium]